MRVSKINNLLYFLCDVKKRGKKSFSFSLIIGGRKMSCVLAHVHNLHIECRTVKRERESREGEKGVDKSPTKKGIFLLYVLSAQVVLHYCCTLRSIQYFYAELVRYSPILLLPLYYLRYGQSHQLHLGWSLVEMNSQQTFMEQSISSLNKIDR
jgi:hypothetical protein